MTSDGLKFSVAKARFTEAKFRPYTSAIGQAALAWNDLHEVLGRMFGLLMPGADRVTPLAVWQALKVDRAKRDMFAVVIDNMGPIPLPIAHVREELKWILKKAEALEDTRNNVIHAPLHLAPPRVLFEDVPNRPTPALIAVKKASVVEPFTWGGHARASNMMKAADLLAEYRWCRDAALVLRDYAREIDNKLSGKRGTLPDRPQWPTRRVPKKGRSGHRSA